MSKYFRKFLALAFITLMIVMPMKNGIATNANAYSQVTSVYLGGTPIGVVAESEGVVVTELTSVVGKNGTENPAIEGGIKVGDFIYRIDNMAIESPSDISSAIENIAGVSATMYIKRDGVDIKCQVTPIFDIVHNCKKLGLMVKNEIAGVGTLTFVTQDGSSYGGLGHQIFESEANKDIYSSGILYASEIIGYVKGEEGKAGQLRGTVDRTKIIGSVEANAYCGVYGYAEEIMCDQRPLISVGDKDAVQEGRAYIYSTIEGTTPEKYEIEIVKAIKQDVDADKGMVIHVTDTRLLETTGGIVQGMSGSPIVQNGKIIGAVTHVFVRDPTRGYGIYINSMLHECDSIVQ